LNGKEGGSWNGGAGQRDSARTNSQGPSAKSLMRVTLHLTTEAWSMGSMNSAVMDKAAMQGALGTWAGAAQDTAWRPRSCCSRHRFAHGLAAWACPMPEAKLGWDFIACCRMVFTLQQPMQLWLLCTKHSFWYLLFILCS